MLTGNLKALHTIAIWFGLHSRPDFEGVKIMPCRLGLSGHTLGNSESNVVTDINSGEIGRGAMSGE